MATRKTKKKPSADESRSLNESSEMPSFEISMERLTKIVEDLEGGELTLEDSLKRFEEGIGLARDSQVRLDAAEARVEELLGVELDGGLRTKEIDMT